MTRTQQFRAPLAEAVASRRQRQYGLPADAWEQVEAPRRRKPRPAQNVSDPERVVSGVSGAILALLGVGRRDLTGALIAGVGGMLVYRGVTGHCSAYDRMGVNTATSDRRLGARPQADSGIHIIQSFLINKSPDQLYDFWRNFENLPQFMSHLKSVQNLDDRRSRWVANAPALVGGEVQWEAEIVTDEPGVEIAWQALPGSDVEHRGAVRFTRALGDRGTAVRVSLEYHPPGGALGRWTAKLFGEEPEQQIRDDLRKFKQLMEIGEIPTIDGQPRGVCTGVASAIRKMVAS